MQRVLISGGSGLIGRQLTQLLLQNGYEVAWLSRGNKGMPGVRMFKWDVATGYIDDAALTWPTVLVHLAGEGIADKRWTEKRKQAIIQSRAASTELLIRKMLQFPGYIKTVIAASAIGFYGQTKQTPVSESETSGKGFLSESVKIWEEATAQFVSTGARLVQLRIGIVLANEGGAYKELLQTEKFRVLPVMGSGKQQYSWIHIQDVTGIFLYAMTNPLEGVFNAVAPYPVTQKQLMQEYQSVSKQWHLLMPVPAFGLKLLLGEMSDVVLMHQLVSSNKIEQAGYQFKYGTINSALKNLLQQ